LLCGVGCSSSARLPAITAAASGNMQVQCGAPQVLFGGHDGSPGLQVTASGGVGQWDWWLAHVCGVAVYGWSVVATALSGVGDRP
jgi:hypothetical protein